jgi:hypothetical protein
LPDSAIRLSEIIYSATVRIDCHIYNTSWERQLIHRMEVLKIPDCEPRIAATGNKDVSREVAFHVNSVSWSLINLARFGDIPFKYAPIIIDSHDMATRDIPLNADNTGPHVAISSVLL